VTTTLYLSALPPRGWRPLVWWCATLSWSCSFVIDRTQICHVRWGRTLAISLSEGLHDVAVLYGVGRVAAKARRVTVDLRTETELTASASAWPPRGPARVTVSMR
jgi:hypothetical protein